MAEKLPDHPEIESLTRSQVLIAIGATAVMLLLLATLWRKLGSVQLLPWSWNGSVLLIGIGLGLTITVASSVIYSLWPAYRKSADYYLELVLKPLIWPDLLWLGLLPGMSEELLFRGVMLPVFGLNLVGLTVSSICFGVLHLSSPKQWPYMIWAILIGFLLGYSAIATNNLLVPIVAHIATNLISSFMWKLGNSSKGDGTSHSVKS